MLKTGHEDSSPRWEQQNPGQDAASDAASGEELPTVPVPVAIPPQIAVVAPRRDPAWRRVQVLTIVQAVVAAILLIGVSIAAVLVIRGPQMPTAVKVGPSIQINLTPVSTSGTPGASTATSPPTSGPAPNGVIKFGGGGDTSVTQTCSGIQPLGSLSIFLDNSQSNVPVDWWVNVLQPTPDGKSPWAFARMPYGTVPAGKSASLTLTPASNLCALLAGGTAPVTFTADIDYGGVGGFRITDIVVPGIGPPPTVTTTITGGVTLPPSH